MFTSTAESYPGEHMTLVDMTGTSTIIISNIDWTTVIAAIMGLAIPLMLESLKPDPAQGQVFWYQP